MGMKAMYDLKEMLCRELEEIAQKGELNVGDLDIIHKLTDTIKNIDKIEMFEEDDGYSRAAEWEGGIRGHSYDRGNSYDSGGYSERRMSRGGYSRDASGMTYSERRGYSRDSGRDKMLREMQDLMKDADDHQKEIIRRAMTELQRG